MSQGVVEVKWEDIVDAFAHSSEKGSEGDGPVNKGVFIIPNRNQSEEVILASIQGWPEVKTVTEQRCITILGKKICTDVPKVYHRTSKLDVIAQFSHPSLSQIKNQVEDCARQAAAAGVVAGALTGQVAAVLPAFVAYMKTCLIAKGVADVGALQIGLYTKITPGPWHPV